MFVKTRILDLILQCLINYNVDYLLWINCNEVPFLNVTCPSLQKIKLINIC